MGSAGERARPAPALAAADETRIAPAGSHPRRLESPFLVDQREVMGAGPALSLTPALQTDKRHLGKSSHGDWRARGTWRTSPEVLANDDSLGAGAWASWRLAGVYVLSTLAGRNAGGPASKVAHEGQTPGFVPPGLEGAERGPSAGTLPNANQAHTSQAPCAVPRGSRSK